MYPKLFIPTTPGQPQARFAVCCSIRGNQVEQWTGNSEQEAITILAAMADPSAAIYELEYHRPEEQ